MTQEEKISAIIETIEFTSLEPEIAEVFIKHIPTNEMLNKNAAASFENFLSFIEMYSYVVISEYSNMTLTCENAEIVSEWNKIFSVPLPYLDYVNSVCAGKES